MDRLPGFRDFYPEPVPLGDHLAWSAEARGWLFEKWRDVARRYGFREYDGPPLEALELYTTKSGEEIVGQLYNFVDKGERAVALRPEMTPTLARMVAAHQRAYKKPIKWFAIPQLFRYERQQKGRLREHFQFNADILGTAEPAADAELIALLIDALRAVGLTAADFVVRISSRQAWQRFFEAHGGVPEQAYAFYQAVDKMGRDAPEVTRQKLAAVGMSADTVKAFIEESRPTPELQAVLDDLAARGLSAYVAVDYHIIRGLAYYTGIVFEAFDRQGQFRALAGGGRYDNLVRLLSEGQADLPALGFGMGDVVLLELLKARGQLPTTQPALGVFCLIEDEGLRADSLRLIQDLREAGLSVDYPLTPTKPDKQLKRALELGATRAVALVRGPTGAPAVRIKNVQSREQTIVPLADAVGALVGRASGPD